MRLKASPAGSANSRDRAPSARLVWRSGLAA